MLGHLLYSKQLGLDPTWHSPPRRRAEGVRAGESARSARRSAFRAASLWVARVASRMLGMAPKLADGGRPGA